MCVKMLLLDHPLLGSRKVTADGKSGIFAVRGKNKRNVVLHAVLLVFSIGYFTFLLLSTDP